MKPTLRTSYAAWIAALAVAFAGAAVGQPAAPSAPNLGAAATVKVAGSAGAIAIEARFQLSELPMGFVEITRQWKEA